MLPAQLRFVVDSHIPFLEGLLEPFGTVRVLAPDEITADAVRDADALLVRTRTRCDASLLAGSRVRFVGTATIGLDHIDQKWCAANGITAVNAPGCNAPAVAQYVFAAIARLINRPVDRHVLGVVGVGHVGSIVERWARHLGMEVMRCDLPRQRAEGGDGWYTLHDIARNADIITFHTPLTRAGSEATWHLADAEFFDSLRRAPILINAARGPIVDTPALIAAIDAGLVSHAVIDTWEGEPRINTELMHRASIATPHIAGYSREGKVRATRMVLDSMCRTLGLPHIAMNEPEPPGVPVAISLPQLSAGYDIMADDRILRDAPDAFEKLRDYYDLRPEAPAHLPD